MIPPVVGNLLSGLGLKGIAITVAALVAFGFWMEFQRRGQRIESLSGALSVAEQANREWTATVERLQAEHARDVAALTRQMQAAESRARRAAGMKEEIRRDANQEDRPVGPVLRNLVDRMRGHAGADDPGGAAPQRP